MRLAVLIFAAATAGCAGLVDRPTQEMVELQLQKKRKLVEFRSDLAPAELISRALASGCGQDRKRMTTLTPTGAGWVGVSGTYDFSLEVGDLPDGSSWVAVRMAGSGHASPMGYTLSPVPDGGSDVTVYAANRRKAAEIQEGVESGRLLCDWRSVSYPYD